MTKILVVEYASYDAPVKALGDVSYDVREFMNKPESFDLVMFTGGADISPELYGHTSPRHTCYCNKSRDTREVYVFNIARKHNIKMTGICRGLQLLNVLAGGTLIHHLDNHTGQPHKMTTFDGSFIVNSLHHQAVILPEGAVPIGWSSERRSNVYIGDKDEPMERWPDHEIEAAILPSINAAAVQYHPEMLPSAAPGFKWYQDLVAALLQADTMEELVDLYTEGNKKKCLCGTSAG